MEKPHYLKRALGRVVYAFVPSLLAGLLFSSCSSGSAPSQAEKPSIILILADDIGNSDMGSYGSEISTPNLDRLAARGIRMDKWRLVAKVATSMEFLLKTRKTGGCMILNRTPQRQATWPVNNRRG